MPKIQNPKLAIKHIKEKSLAECTVTCQIFFFPDELEFMKNNPLTKYNLKCRLLGDDSGPGKGGDDVLWVFNKVLSYPDKTPTQIENAEFSAVLGDDQLDEDGVYRPQDEIYGKLTLAHRMFPQPVSAKTNIVKIYA
jgi:hypothetical protein